MLIFTEVRLLGVDNIVLGSFGKLWNEVKSFSFRRISKSFLKLFWVIFSSMTHDTNFFCNINLLLFRVSSIVDRSCNSLVILIYLPMCCYSVNMFCSNKDLPSINISQNKVYWNLLVQRQRQDSGGKRTPIRVS